MLCQNCQSNIANVHLTHIINGKKVEMHLCEQCAKEKGQYGVNPQLNFFSYLFGMPGIGSGSGYSPVGQYEPPKCNVCGMSFDDFKRTGKIGCANCYNVFRDNLIPILRRLHGSTEHTGKIPAKTARSIQNENVVERLKQELAEAISKEEYERAAELRDRIRELENTGNMQGGD